MDFFITGVLDKLENELQDLMASLNNKLKKDSTLQPMVDKAESKLTAMTTFMKESRLLLAVWDEISVNEQVPDKVFEELELLIAGQVSYSENAKIAKKKIAGVL
jgi:hypothetical protein